MTRALPMILGLAPLLCAAACSAEFGDAPAGTDGGGRGDAAATADARLLPAPQPNCHYVEVLSDGAFDEGSSAWGERATNGLAIVRSAESLAVPPATPPRAAWLAGYANSTDRIWQDVTIPDDARALVLSASWCAFTLDDDDAVDDVLGFLIQEPGTRDTYEVAHSLANLDADPGEGACTWKSFSKPLARPYAGQTIMLKIYGSCDGDGPTDFFLDDVSLAALVCD